MRDGAEWFREALVAEAAEIAEPGAEPAAD